jgi:hypothetical protein
VIDESLVREALESLVADVVPQHAAPGREIVRRARQRESRRRIVATVVSVAVVGLVAVPLAIGWAPTAIDSLAGKGPSVPSVATVTCAPQGTFVAQAEVATSVDGVHFRIVNQTGNPVDVGYRLQPDATWNNLDPVITPPPGTIEVACSRGAGRTRDTPVSVRIVNPHRYWAASSATQFSCALTAVPANETTAAIGADPRTAGETLARSQGLYLGLQQSGYREQSPTFFIEVQDQTPNGQIGTVPVGIIEVTRTADHKWTAVLTQQCPTTGT